MEAVNADEVFIVPNFISEGYFTRTVLPRELRLEGPVTRRDGKVIKYCPPAGCHPRMTELLLQKARAAAPDIPPWETSLFIVGHGTPRHANSAAAAREQADKIRHLGEYAEVLPAYLEEEPRIADWHLVSRQPNVVVVAFFIADGLHGDQDIPALLGLSGEAPGKPREKRIHGRRLFYGGTVGGDPAMADIILDQVRASEDSANPGSR